MYSTVEVRRYFLTAGICPKEPHSRFATRYVPCRRMNRWGASVHVDVCRYIYKEKVMRKYNKHLLLGLAAGFASITALPYAASAAAGANKGTALSATAGIAEIRCTSETEAEVDLLAELTTTGSVDSALVYLSIDSSEPVHAGTINPQDFVHTGRIKTAESLLTNTLTNGEHTIQACFTQSGAQGRPSKATCAEPVTFTVDCAADS